MDGPTTVRLQRRRNELPPDQLFVERRGPEKRKLTGDGPPRGHYVRQKRGTDHSDISSAQSDSRASKLESTESSLPSTEADASVLETRRIFHLRRSSPVVPSSQSAGSRKRKSNSDLATVVEKKLRNVQGDSVATQSHQIDKDVTQTSAPSAPLKRPGRGSAIRPRTNKVDPTKAENENVVARQQRELAALAQEMHQFALDELAKTPKPQIKTKPKLSPARSRALHEQQAPATPSHAAKTKDADDDTAMEDSDGEYVYDTYVLATAPTSLDAQGSGKMHDPDSIANIGYLIIEQDDEQQWEAYIHDLEGSDSEPTDEDDENAEDYYGADYPSDELATDDEFDRGGAAYGYRARRGSNNEQYDLENDDDEPTWSDEEDMRMMNPFAKKESGSSRVERQFAKYLNRKKAAEEE